MGVLIRSGEVSQSPNVPETALEPTENKELAEQI
jgi:hypothetical protein